MATPRFNTKSPTIKRILREAAELSSSPSPDYTAEPLETDLFEWHFTLKGPPNSVYAEGVYHGRIVLPASYPLRPPSFRFMTPSGRFEANREICLSISGHHEETWQPAWGVRTALVALRSFMETDARGQLGGLETTEAVRRRLATESKSYKCPTCGKTNGEIVKECEQRAKEAASPSQEVEVPKELNMGWRDEMEAQKNGSGNSETSKDNSDSAELAEGFVPTVQDGAILSTAEPVPVAVSAPAPAAAAAGNLEPRLPAAIHASAASTATAHRRVVPTPPELMQPPRRATDDSVPVWIDRTIVALVVLLLALILKIMFSG